MNKLLRNHRVGELSSKYAYSDADLDIDVAIKRMKHARIKDNILKIYKKSNVESDVLKIIFIEILEELGALSLTPDNTNGGKIRRMTNEELAKLLSQDSCKTCPYQLDVSCHEQECIEGHLQWLKQEGVNE